MSVRRRLGGELRWAVAVVLSAIGVLAWLRRRRGRHGRVPVLTFHRIAGRPGELVPLGLAPEWIRGIFAGVAGRYCVEPWETTVEVVRGGDCRPRLAFTFDDGYAEHATEVWPALRGAGMTGMFFVTTGVVDKAEPFWWDVVAAAFGGDQGDGHPIDRAGNATYPAPVEAEISRLKTVPEHERRIRIAALRTAIRDAHCCTPAMRWPDVERLAAEGAEIGGHGVTHSIFTRCDDDELTAETAGCQATLRQHLGQEVSLLAYPNGDCDERVVRAAAASGFRWAFTTQHGEFTAACDPLRIPRITVSGAICSPDGRRFSWSLFEAELLGVFDVLMRRRRRGLR